MIQNTEFKISCSSESLQFFLQLLYLKPLLLDLRHRFVIQTHVFNSSRVKATVLILSLSFICQVHQIHIEICSSQSVLRTLLERTDRRCRGCSFVCVIVTL